MNKFLNENWKEILGEVQPAFQEALGATFKEIATRLFTKVPYDDIFLKQADFRKRTKEFNHKETSILK